MSVGSQTIDFTDTRNLEFDTLPNRHQFRCWLRSFECSREGKRTWFSKERPVLLWRPARASSAFCHRKRMSCKSHKAKSDAVRPNLIKRPRRLWNRKEPRYFGMDLDIYVLGRERHFYRSGPHIKVFSDG